MTATSIREQGAQAPRGPLERLQSINAHLTPLIHPPVASSVRICLVSTRRNTTAYYLQIPRPTRPKYFPENKPFDGERPVKVERPSKACPNGILTVEGHYCRSWYSWNCYHGPSVQKSEELELHTLRKEWASSKSPPLIGRKSMLWNVS